MADLRVDRKVEHVVLHDSHPGLPRVMIPELLCLMPGIFDNLGVLLMAWNHFSCRVRK